MDIECAFELYEKADAVPDPFMVAPDLNYVIYDEEHDYIWKMVTLPIDSVGADLSLEATPGCTKEDEDVRFEGIQTWMDSVGLENALSMCPPIARMTDEFGLDLVDGRHRLALAHQAGVKKVKFLLGAAPGWTPKPAMVLGVQ